MNHFICTQNEFTFTLHKNRVLKSVPLQWNIESLFPSKYKIQDIDIHIKKENILLIIIRKENMEVISKTVPS